VTVCRVADFGSALRNLENAEDSVRGWDCDFMNKLKPQEEQKAQQLHASLCFIEQSGFEMPADALGGRAGEFSCGPTSFCLEEVLSTKPAKLCIQCRHSSSSLLRGFSCDLTTSQCVCGERDLTASRCGTTEDCGLSDSVCDVQASFYSGSYTTQLCIDSPGRSYCLKGNMHDGVGVCTSFVNEPVNLVPSCQITDLNAEKWSFSENKCLGYDRDLGSTRGGVLMSDTFVFPCLDIVALGRAYKLACISIVLDSSIQNSIKSFLTYDILGTPAFGLAGGRRLLEFDEFGPNASSYNTSSRSMLAVFVQQSAARIHRVVGTCRQSLQSCLSPQPDPGCAVCARMWWFSNFTLSTPVDSTDAANIVPCAVRDTDLLDARSIMVMLAHNPALFPRILHRAPQGVAVLLQDWLQDDTTYHFLARHMRHPVEMLDDFVHRLMQSLLPPRPAIATAVHRHQQAQLLSVARKQKDKDDTGSSHRRLLQLEDASPRDASTFTQDSGKTISDRRQATDASLSSTRDTAIAQIQTQVPFFDVSLFGQIFGDVAARNEELPDDLARILTETFSDAFDSSDSKSCMLSFGTVQNDIIMNFARVLSKDGWTVKPVCTRAQLVAFSQTIPVCPILTAPFTRAYTNTLIIAQYYAFMVQSTCLTNMSVSCMRPAEYTEQGIINALPRLSRDPKFTNQTQQQDLMHEKDIISYYIIRFFYAITDLISFDRAFMMSSVMAFSSTDALYDDDILDEMVRKNEYSIGRLLHDYFNCGLKDTISCNSKNLSLLPVVASLFIVICIIHFVLPVPSVVSFFLWTLGLTYGVIYMSYNFSPLCSPRIPTCIGHGVYELVQQVLPLRIQIPTTLYHADKCNSDLTLKPEYVTKFPGFACGKTCLHPPYEMKDIITVLIAFETWIRYDRAVYLEEILTQFDFLLPHSLTMEYLAVIDKYNTDIHNNADGYVLGFVTCIFFNIYKLVAFFIIVTIFLPFCFSVVFSLVTFIGVLVLKYSFFAYGTDIYANMH